MRLIYLARYLLLTTLYQVLYSNATCSCGTQSCTNIQVGYHTYIQAWCSNYGSMSESSCYDMLVSSANVWIVNFRPDLQQCRVSECDTTYAIRRSIYGMIMYRKTCDTGCLNYTLTKHDSCWTQPSPPAVLALQYYASSEIECLQNCLPPTKSCIVVYDSSFQECEVFENVDTSDSPTCIQTGSSLITYYVTCYDNVQVKTCEVPDAISYGSVNYTDLSISSTATYYCDTGHEVIGTATITCQANLQWSTPLPYCQIVDCNAPPTVAYAIVSPADSSDISISTTFGSSVTYNCEMGYTLSGSSNVACLDSGSWESTLPSCQIVDCNDPPNVTHATIVAMTTTYNSTATYTCAAQYTIVGTATVSCLNDGQWGPSVPSCTLVDCQAPPNVTNASVSFTVTTSGSYATYTCFTSHTRVGPPSIVCQGNGNWTQPTVKCAPKGNSVNTTVRALYITPCTCSTGSFFVNMTEDEIIAKLIADTAIKSKETTLSQYSLKCRPDNRTSSLIAGIVGISVLSIVFGTMFCIDLLKLLSYFKRNSAE